MPRLVRIALGAAIALVIGCTFAPPPPGPFYEPGNSIPSTPGEVIRHEPIQGAPEGSQAYRVLYSSTGLDGKPIAVSGLVIIPQGPAPTRGWDVVAWAHPTTGVATVCAPSLRKEPLKNIFGMEQLLLAGYVVTATDYPGLGGPGVHPYLVGLSEGRAVLDLVRAARKLPGEKIGPRFAVWGHSQGGQASLFAGQLAASYAPELALVGVGAAAPATDLGKLLDDDINSLAGRVLVAYALWSWSRVYDVDIDSIVNPKVVPIVDRVTAGCIETYGEVYNVAMQALPLRKEFLREDPDSTQPYVGFLEENRPGKVLTAAPFFIAQGSVDPIVRPSVTRAFAAHLCSRGETVRFLVLEDVGHMGAGEKAAGPMVSWMRSLFAGNPPPNDCAALTKN
jgi:pimeloyl-ACP methyl ester carboxylesterase